VGEERKAHHWILHCQGWHLAADKRYQNLFGCAIVFWDFISAGFQLR